LSELEPEKLAVSFIPPASIFNPMDGRKYTLTHSDTTEELFLSVGCVYDFSKVNAMMRDEVLAEWVRVMGQYTLSGTVYVSSGEFDKNLSKVRFMIFQKELPLAITAIVNGDNDFFTYFPWLLDAPIYMSFDSIYPDFNQVKYYGTPRQYLLR
jgi:L-rhamnose mutarotase